MSTNTHGNLILFIVVGVVLTGCGILVFRAMSGKKTGCPSGQSLDATSGKCYKTCSSGETYYDAYAIFNGGCLPCDPTDTTNCATCSDNGDCKNSGTCMMVNGPSPGKGICQCTSPYTGNTCDGVCTSAGGQCLNGGTCVSGTCQCTGPWTGQFCENAQTFTCSQATCTAPMCIYKAGTDNNDPTCTCAPHVIPDSSTGSPCGKCEDGYGPKNDCSKKYFDTSIFLSTPSCWNRATNKKGGDVSTECTNTYGMLATWDGNSECGYMDGDGCGLTLNRRQLCNVNKYYADPSFDPDTWEPCDLANLGKAPSGYTPHN